MKALGIDDIPKGPYPVPKVPVSALSDAIRMESFCRESACAGASAPQFGISSRLFVYWKNYPEDPKTFCHVVDCEYEGVGDCFLSVESCPSLPGMRFSVKRYLSIKAKGRLVVEDSGGRIKFSDFEDVFSGVESAIIQHEVDHMNGVTIDMIGERMNFR
jgi:peptide deformylase